MRMLEEYQDTQAYPLTYTKPTPTRTWAEVAKAEMRVYKRLMGSSPATPNQTLSVKKKEIGEANRKEILQLIKKNPGIDNLTMCEHLGMTRQNLWHYLSQLCRQGLIEADGHRYKTYRAK
jgi:biotin operon repressor